ncbi:hypothetical protein [Mycoplasma sp. P36-A1]|uniref:hypothetical protein n=1 Tax=Mycoplasma sp. P36-A1 TaxID=3252900 RepID=UPI003C2B74AD
MLKNKKIILSLLLLLLTACGGTANSVDDIGMVVFKKESSEDSLQKINDAKLYYNSEVKEYANLKHGVYKNTKFNNSDNSIVVDEFSCILQVYKEDGSAKTINPCDDLKGNWIIESINFDNDNTYLTISSVSTGQQSKKILRKLDSDYQKVQDYELDEAIILTKIDNDTLYYVYDSENKDGEYSSILSKRKLSETTETKLYEFDDETTISNILVNSEKVNVIIENLEDNIVKISEVKENELIDLEQIASDETFIFDSLKIEDGSTMVTYGVVSSESNEESNNPIIDVNSEIGLMKIDNNNKVTLLSNICDGVVPSLTSTNMYCINSKEINVVNYSDLSKSKMSLPKDLKLEEDQLLNYNFSFFNKKDDK